MKHRSSPHGFALVAVLAVLLVVTILLVAFATTMRTERAASQNFVDRDRTEAIAAGVLNRIIAEHATPEINGAPLQAFAVNKTSGLPTDETATNYFGATSTDETTTGPNVPTYKDDPSLKEKLLPIYEMVPDNPDAFEENGLVRTSQSSGGGGAAYSKEFWAYDGLTQSILGSRDAEPTTVPEWVDYYQPDDPSTPENEAQYPVAQVAYAIWDEGGKLDVNVIGKDDTVNGIAPHDLKVEDEVTSDSGRQLFAFLNNQNGNGERDRNNFSLRNIVSPFGVSATTGSNDEGDDRWVFSVRELIQRGLITSDKFRMVTTNSRDFDVRPEWDGDRAPRYLRGSGATLGAEDFLRSYINNPALFGLFYGSGGAGPYLVYNNLNEEQLNQRLTDGSANLDPSPSSTDEAHADWMQVMRLLAVLRRGLPPYTSGGINDILSGPNGVSADYLIPNSWNPFDVWGVAQNLIQASDPAYDYNLVAFNPYGPNVNGFAYRDPNVRVGVRLSPYIAEVAVKVKRESDGWHLTNYLKLWNPYPYRLLDRTGNPIKYRIGFHTGDAWPTTNVHGLYSMWSTFSHAENITAPEPGQFKVIRFTERIILSTDSTTVSKIATNPYLRTRPYIELMDYSPGYTVGVASDTPYQCVGMACYYAGTVVSDNYDQLIANLSGITGMDVGKTRWYSFQIDDPRMGSIKRDTVKFTGGGTVGGRLAATQPAAGGTYPTDAETNINHKWTWILYDQQAMAGVPVYSTSDTVISDSDTASNTNGKSILGVAGYNRNFGLNWPGITPNDLYDINPRDAARMLSTFALPGRPLLNIGEIGTVFAFRPWVTLNFANKIVPDAIGNVTPSIDVASTNKALLRPAAILDYFTTIGTSESIDFDNPDQNKLRYLEPLTGFSGGSRPSANPPPFIQANMNRRYQDKTWLFEEVGGTIDSQDLTGNLRPIRGRINLNTANTDVLAALLKAPYRLPASIGLKNFPGLTVDTVHGSITNPENTSDYLVTIDESDAQDIAEAITARIDDSKAIRPLRMLSDLSQLYDTNPNLMDSLYQKYPQSVITAIIGRLAQFGTVRQQCYTVDMVVRTLNSKAKEKGKNIVTGEARLQARVFFDTFSRKAFIESMEYR